MTTIESQTGNQEAIAGLAALVGDVAQDNARLPGQAASAFGALMGSLGQQATPVPDEAPDDAQLLADEGGGQDEQALAPEPQVQKMPQAPGDALMRAMWPARQMAAPALTAPTPSMGDTVPPPVSLSVGEAAVPAENAEAPVEAKASPQATQVLLPEQPVQAGATGASAATPRPQQPVPQSAAPQADTAQTPQATRLDVVPAAGLPRALQPQATEQPRDEASAESAPSQAAVGQDADSVMAWQRAAYAQAMAMPAPQPTVAATADAPSDTDAVQSVGEGNVMSDVAPTLSRASSAPTDAYAQTRAALAGGEQASATPEAPEAAAKITAGPAAPARGAQAAPMNAAGTPQADAATASAYAQAVPPTEARSSARRGDDGTREESAEADDGAAASGAATTPASFFPASMMPAAVQPQPTQAQTTPVPERAPEAPRFDANTAFERSAQARSLSRSNAAAEARDSEAAEVAENTPAADTKTTPFQHALQGSQAALVDGTDAQRGVQGTQDLQAANAAAVPKEAVSHELSQAITQGANRVQMRIVPEGLGELDIKVQMTGQQVHLTIRGDAPELAQLLSHKVHELRQDLQSQGLSLEAMDFGALASGSQGSFGQDGRPGNSYGGPNQGEAMGSGELHRLAGSRAQAPIAGARVSPGRGPSTRIIDVVL